MASFFENLWNSVFTPGPTPTLLRITNVTFAALQVCLFTLLVATYSIHFVILSILSGGLWFSINWFARELAIVLEQQEREKQKAATEAEAVPIAHSEDSDDTEVEASATGKQTEQRALRSRKTAGSASREVEVEEVDVDSQLKKRVVEEGIKGGNKDNGMVGTGPSSVAGTQSSVSTEDEWEKVSENENEKDK